MEAVCSSPTRGACPGVLTEVHTETARPSQTARRAAASVCWRLPSASRATLSLIPQVGMEPQRRELSPARRAGGEGLTQPAVGLTARRPDPTDEIVALKRLKMEKEKEGFPITSLREINTILKAQHPNIVTVRVSPRALCRAASPHPHVEPPLQPRPCVAGDRGGQQHG